MSLQYDRYTARNLITVHTLATLSISLQSKTVTSLNAVRVDILGKATRYGPDVSVMEYRRRAAFSATVQTCPGDHPASYTMYIGSLSRGLGRGVGQLIPSSVEVNVCRYTATPYLGLHGLLQGEPYLTPVSISLLHAYSLHGAESFLRS